MENHPFPESELDPSLRGSDRNAELHQILHHNGAEIPAGHDRLAALAQHIVEASGAHNDNPLSMEQTLDQQQQQQAVAAVDLLSFAGEGGSSYGENYNLEGLLGQQQAESRQGLGNDDDANRDFGAVGGSGYHIDDTLNGALSYNPDLAGGGQDGQQHGDQMDMDKSGMHDHGLEDDHSGQQGGGRKRKRKGPVGEDSIKQKKEVHKEVERRRRAMINDGIEGIVALLPNPDKQKGAILAQAANYIRELQQENMKNGEELAMSTVRYESEIKELQTSLAAALSRYESEHAHCERLERSWRDAEARVSALRLELDGLRGLTTQDGHADAAETAE